MPAGEIVATEAEFPEVAHQHVRIEDAHHQLLAESRRQGRQAQLDFTGITHPRLDPSVLGAALLDHVHAAEQLDPTRHRDDDGQRNLIDVMQHAIDPKADHADLASGLDVDVARTLFERVLPQPVHDRDDMGVVRIDSPTRTAQFDQLLEVALAAGTLRCPGGLGLANRAREAEELDDVSRQVVGIGQHATDGLAQQVFELVHPTRDERLRGRDRDLARGHLQRQDPIARRVLARHHLGHPRQVHLQRVDPSQRHPHTLREPLAESIEIEWLAIVGRLQAARGQSHERVFGTARHAIEPQHLIGVLRAQHAVGQQCRHQPGDDQRSARIAQRRDLRMRFGRR